MAYEANTSILPPQKPAKPTVICCHTLQEFEIITFCYTHSLYIYSDFPDCILKNPYFLWGNTEKKAALKHVL